MEAIWGDLGFWGWIVCPVATRAHCCANLAAAAASRHYCRLSRLPLRYVCACAQGAKIARLEMFIPHLLAKWNEIDTQRNEVDIIFNNVNCSPPCSKAGDSLQKQWLCDISNFLCSVLILPAHFLERAQDSGEVLVGSCQGSAVSFSLYLGLWDKAHVCSSWRG